jgi:hypothetical protein
LNRPGHPPVYSQRMDWLWILLRYLFPTDPARQAAEAARQCIATLVAEFFAPETLAVLAADDSARAYIEAIINDYEACVHLAIGASPTRLRCLAESTNPPRRRHLRGRDPLRLAALRRHRADDPQHAIGR